MRGASWASWMIVICSATGGALLAAEPPPAPTDRTPDGALAVFSDEPEIVQIQQDAWASWRKAQSLVAEIDQEATPQGHIDALSRAFMAVRQFERLLRRMIDAKEPAGIEFELRYKPLLGMVREQVNELKKQPEIQKLLAKHLKTFAAEARKREKIIAQADKLARDGKWDEAEALLFSVVDELDAFCIWYDSTVGDQLLRPYMSPVKIVTQKTGELRRGRRFAAMKELIPVPRPSPVLSQKTLKFTVDSIRASGKAEYDGAERTGPEVLGLLTERWKKLDASVLRTHALEIYGGAGKGAERLLHEQTNFDEELRTLVVDLIASDAARTTSDRARETYDAYLDAAIPLVALSGNLELENNLTLAFDRLAARSPELLAEVRAYRTATAGMLAWRKRVATAAAKARQIRYPALWRQAHESLQKEGEFQGLYGEDRTAQSIADPAHRLVVRAGESLLQRGVSVTHVMSPAADGQSAFSLYNGGTYAAMTAPKLPDFILDSLRRDLLVTGSSRPRTLEAGVALYLAEQGMFDAVGGDVVGLQFEVLLARAGVVTEQDVTFVRPGLVEIDWVEPHKQVLLRCELQPKWLRHRYLFVEFPVRATAAR